MLLKIGGAVAHDKLGKVSKLGDFNGDGWIDLFVGASFSKPGSPARTNAGSSYVIFGYDRNGAGYSDIDLLPLKTSASSTGFAVTSFIINPQSTNYLM